MNVINWSLVMPIIILQLILMVFALFNCAKQAATNGPKWMWVLIIIFINIFGPILYFIIGRKAD
ncbi:Negative regulatory protein YxlE [Alkalihalobacillus alcalophilus ATCC 27647 = CGMCC 1.3604]|uniref:Negative regulatory protein YxlE n=1 Tax=Alkalihalobacillus alcalophilus ATCC 27647 = CGMCC 1.3604 TaxID=1218173 RepID=A0A094WL82_ALKAL|nr:PLD nuclease N-terminal domain-containing protein [Alkalihalobacillus alcalophilus]KGA96693.1 Negative regulatory protein YxlE [Alkalihalobacillus alcalophilus ATCC 27647 = CGMCC 1.3604]MED1562375.1 PLD nuclease N-terminal domain-containing protein [Alkalihalobacillus alcalophilus]